MTARERLHALRRAIVVTLVARALLVGVGIACAGIALSRALGLPSAFLPAVVAAALITSALLAARSRAARSLEQVALWVEERHPALRYALVTVAGGSAPAAVESQATAIRWWDDVGRTLRRALVAPAVGALAAVALLVWRPSLRVPRVHDASATAHASGAGPTGTVRDVLATVHATVAPPAYSGRPTVAIDDPTSVEALVGSTITLTGNGEARLLKATLDSAARAVAPRGDRWSLTLAMPARPALVRLRSALGRERLVVLAPIADAVPGVTLLVPARDTIVRVATGVIGLRAQLRDDVGLRDGAFELIVSSGQDENFTFRTTTLGRRALAGANEATLEARLSLDSLALKPGDMLQLRAVARDGNTIGGPGLGSSETRAIRVARAGEYDSVAVEAAPPAEAEGQVLSQRMLINLAEALERRRARLPRPTVLEESRRIAADQRKLRKRVGDIVFQRLGGEPLSEEGSDEEHPAKLTPEELLKRAEEATHANVGATMDVEGDETPILAVNKPLLEAFNAMWDAGRSLEQGEPGRALPAMRRALAAIERARQAERIYLRGRPSAVIVDVAKARLAGKDKGASSELAAAPAADPVARRRAETFARATALLARDPSAAADSLLVLRVNALGNAPALAAALDDAARTLRKGDARAIELAWARLRRALGGPLVRRDSLSGWSGAP